MLGVGGDANALLLVDVFGAIALLGYWLFRSFLSLRALQPRLERVFFGLTCVFAAAALYAPWSQPDWYRNGMQLLALAQLVVAGSALVVAVRQHVRVAVYFGIAYAGFFAGSLMWFVWSFAAPSLGPLAPVFELGVELGTVFQALTLALGLADRIAFANEERDRAQRHTIEEISTLNVAYSRFVPRTFLDLLGKDDVRDVALGDGIEREMTVLFSDVRSFTTISEALSPNETFGFINGLLRKHGTGRARARRDRRQVRRRCDHGALSRRPPTTACAPRSRCRRPCNRTTPSAKPPASRRSPSASVCTAVR